MLYGINPLSDGQAGAPKAGLRIGKYKLLSWGYTIAGVENANSTGPTNCPSGAAGCDKDFRNGPVLYDLEADPTETTNLASQQPEVVTQILARLKEFAEGSVQPMQWYGAFYVLACCCFVALQYLTPLSDSACPATE